MICLSIVLVDGTGQKQEIPSLPGIHRYSLDILLKEIESGLELGLGSFVLFPAVEESMKDKTASYSMDPDNFYLKAASESNQIS